MYFSDIKTNTLDKKMPEITELEMGKSVAPDGESSSGSGVDVSFLVADLTKSLEAQVNAFATLLEEKHGVAPSDTFTVWNSSSDLKLTYTAAQRKPAVAPKTSRRQKTELSGTPCPYAFRKGDRLGQECKAGVPSDISEVTNLPRVYCNKHKRYEGQESKPVKGAPKSAPKQKAPAVSNVSSKPVAKTKLVVAKDPVTKRFIHAPTQAVIDRKTKSVIGIQLEDGSLRKLTQTDVEAVTAYNLKVHPEAEIEGEDEEEEEVEMEEEEESLEV